MRITLEISEADFLRLAKLVTNGEKVNEAETPAIVKPEKEVKPVQPTANHVDTDKEKAEMAILVSQCQDIVRHAVQNGKRDKVLYTFNRLGIKTISTASGGQLIEFKELMQNA